MRMTEIAIAVLVAVAVIGCARFVFKLSCDKVTQAVQLLSLLSQRAELWYENDFKTLTNGITEIKAPKKGESLLPLFGDKAFAVAVNEFNVPTMVAGTYGEVRTS